MRSATSCSPAQSNATTSASDRGRLAVIPDASATNLAAFLADTVEPGSSVITNGWASYPAATRGLSGQPDRQGLAGAVEQVARLGAQLLLQAALEAEVSEFLGCGGYARQAGSDETRKGMRNGYCPTTIKTTAEPVTLERPKLRGTTERCASQLFGTGVLRTNALEALVIASFVRGLSVRDAEATLTEALAVEATVSKSTVSRICGQLKEQYPRRASGGAWCRRGDLVVPSWCAGVRRAAAASSQPGLPERAAPMRATWA